MFSRIAILVASFVVALTPVPARALFHLAHIHELMSGVGGDPSVQYVEIRMANVSQNLVKASRLTAFNCDGTTVTILLLVPANVPNGGTDDRWIMATTTFAAAAGITPDFTWTGIVPTSCGMVCWGAPGGGIPQDPPTWDASLPNNYVDCVAYGPYTGPTKTTSGTPTLLTPGDGTFSLTRIAFGGNNLTDFALACPTPENNAGAIGGFGACTPPTTTTSTTSTTTTSTTIPPPAPSKCTSAKFKEAGKKVAGKTKCQSKAVGKGDAVDAACLTKAEGKFSTGWGKAEAKGDCATTGDEAAIEAKVDALVADLVAELTGLNPGPSKCTSGKLKAAGKKAASKAKCLSKAAAKALPVDPACLGKADSKFSTGWGKAEAKADCLLPTGDLAAIEAKVDAFLDDLESEL